MKICFQLRPYNIKDITQQNKELRVATGIKIFGHFNDLIYKNRILFSSKRLRIVVKK